VATPSSTRIGVVTFPGSLDDRDALRAVTLAGATPVPLWHADRDLDGVDAVVLPGGFSYGDYLRAGAIARFSPMVATLIEAAHDGLPVLGICNGFQVLCEAGLLPGALTRNAGLRFVCRDQQLRVETAGTYWTRSYARGATLVIPVKHGDGRYVADPATITQLEAEDRVVMRYLGGNPNGSLADIAGVCSADGRVVGLMPHPEHAVETLTGPGEDGLGMFTSLLSGLPETAVSAAGSPR
jgi:phosphoribosylformylglycinamidine synthase